jgi:MoaA/NifB/PqqE/SkfB family radical SAM enzyme
MSADAESSHQTKGLLRLTMACNERCPFCNVPVEDYPKPTPADEAIAAELDTFIASGERTLTISGGEPTLLRKRLLRVVAEARARGVPFVELQTNAVLIDTEYATALASAGLTSAFVSLLSDDPALHDRLAGLEGAFPRCLAGIDALGDAGVRVTLNPVTAAATQDRLPDYVSFVAARLPRVRSISVSVVQPHGRAAKNLDLLPDYAVLGPAVREARRRAAALGIELLNPYCGLPLCVGWEDGLDVSVEAVEARQGGWRGTPGIENTGDKRQGFQCRACVFRGRCGGAWHAYWEVRGGSGLTPPARLGGPWAPGPHERLLAKGEGPPADGFGWIYTEGVGADDADRLVSAGISVAIALPAAALGDAAALRGLHRLARRRSVLPLQRRPPLWLVAPAAAARRAITLATALDLDAVALRDADPARTDAEQHAFAADLTAKHAIDVRVVPTEWRLISG